MAARVKSSVATIAKSKIVPNCEVFLATDGTSTIGNLATHMLERRGTTLAEPLIFRATKIKQRRIMTESVKTTIATITKPKIVPNRKMVQAAN